MSLTVVDWFVLRNLLVIKAEFPDIDVGTMETVEVLPDRKIQGNRGWTLKQVLYDIRSRLSLKYSNKTFWNRQPT